MELITRPIPDDVMKRHHEVVLGFGVMFINAIPFAVSVSRALKFGTVEAVSNRRKQTLLTGINSIKETYARRGLLANTFITDNEFAELATPLSGLGIRLNVVSRDEHVPEVERHICTLKERCRATYNSLPFTMIHSHMLIEMTYTINFWIHAVTVDDGVSAHIIPRELITGLKINAKKHCMLPFGSYVQLHEEHDNTMAPRTVVAIALGLTGNAQGGHRFFSLMTDRVVSRNT